MRTPDVAVLPSLALFTAMILWASSYIAMKVAVGGYHPVVVMSGRLLLGSCTLAFGWRYLRQIRIRRQDIPLLLLLALCEPCIYFLLEGYAMQLTSASQAGMVVSSLPIFVALGAFLFLGERLSLRVWTGFIIAMIGVCWLSLAGVATDHAPNPLLGNTLEMLAMASASVYVVIAKRLSPHYPPLFITTAQCVVGMLFFMLLYGVMPSIPRPTTVDLPAIGSIVYLGTIITTGAYGLYNYGVSKMPAGQASAWGNLIPVAALIMGQTFLDEVLTVQQYWASALVLGGVYLSQKRQSARQ